jgi:hypothetical protein
MVNPAEAWHFHNLDDVTRDLMSQEFEANIVTGTVYQSKRFTSRGRADHHGLFREAIEAGTPDSLTAAFERDGRIAQTELGHRKVPNTAAASFAAGEFNRYYIRAICLRAIASDAQYIRVYRARRSAEHRATSDAIVGSQLLADQVLEDARRDPAAGGTPLFGVPGGPNSGLSIELL